ncbi:MAG: hypothetical protein CVV13_07520 [Gammaproteobacteria bacterium HGW-Gammaproteobacteria-3]|nr:MAG: hypothetical protein CVV13_07520 [Gammaproteobacteria bacterium HGW-Gammaproteobacteria-3]
MKARYPTDITNQARAAFIDMLSAEFMAQTGVGVYVYLTPIAVNQLFKEYLQRRESIRLFTKNYVRNVSAA